MKLTPFVQKIALQIGAIDVPNVRKVHTRTMPRMGGLAIYAAFVITLLGLIYFLPGSYFHSARDANLIKALLTGGSMIVLTGALDDWLHLSAKIKLLLQIIGACIVVFGFDVTVNFVSIPFNDQNLSIEWWIAAPLTIFWIVGVTNAINLIDGLDGLAAGVSAIALATILIMAAIMGNVVVMFLAVILLGSIIGFMFFNFHPAKIFMGDTGSLFLGFSLAILSMLGFKQIAMMSFITPVLIIGVPLSDTFFAIIRRWQQKKPIFAPDKGHLHHCLGELGFSHRQTVFIIYGIAIFFSLLAIIQSIAVSNDANWVTFVVICILLVALQIGAEVIGLVSKTSKPILHAWERLRIKVQTESRSK